MKRAGLFDTTQKLVHPRPEHLNAIDVQPDPVARRDRARFVPCRDGKYRYLQRRRGEIYTFMKKEISGTLDVPVYLCMESSDIWRRVYGDMPLKMRDMHDIFTIARNADPPADSGASPGRKVVL